MATRKSITVTITSTDQEIGRSLFGVDSVERGSTHEVTPDLMVRVNEHRSVRGFGEPEVLQLVLTFASTTSSGLIVAWFTDRLRNRKALIDVEGKRATAADETGLRQAVDDAVGAAQPEG
jgi:hypothetical protein